MAKRSRLFRDLSETERAAFLRKRRNFRAEARRKGAVKFQDSYHGVGRYSLQAWNAAHTLVMDREYAY